MDFKDQSLCCSKYLYQLICHEEIEKVMKFKIVVNGFIVVFAMVGSLSGMVLLIQKLLTYSLLVDYLYVEPTVVVPGTTFAS